MSIKASLKEFKGSLMSIKDSLKEFKGLLKDFKDSLMEFKASLKEFKDSLMEFKDSLKEFKDSLASFPACRLGMYSQRFYLLSTKRRRSLPEWVPSLKAGNQSETHTQCPNSITYAP
ncbi:hypothetical protein [Nostoc sp. 'Peltigera membranacea cyanobiont' 210A]|uniref:hypothetical protein n=1 Tax=Nostoc sp. 'Peltigera membranacea cyanobiont' 210A TaxID=2014529 RepID=UPI00167E6B3A|nr:hypothetical protein [Nostoc sp. 'Peltigera membranacea cyanobiont' 210A]